MRAIFVASSFALKLAIRDKQHSRFFSFTCEESRIARAYENAFATWPSVGPAITRTYVTPRSGISTRRALLAFRYCCVSTLLDDQSFVISTCGARDVKFYVCMYIHICLTINFGLLLEKRYPRTLAGCSKIKGSTLVLISTKPLFIISAIN